ncbi:hypothetical protein Ptr902_12689 [Pyrenophora tritici-repentis]|nr:hypothetical protein Ptr902_12689 [Pyrenophora tritici-repentis]
MLAQSSRKVAIVAAVLSLLQIITFVHDHTLDLTPEDAKSVGTGSQVINSDGGSNTKQVEESFQRYACLISEITAEYLLSITRLNPRYVA